MYDILKLTCFTIWIEYSNYSKVKIKPFNLERDDGIINFEMERIELFNWQEDNKVIKRSNFII